MDPKTTKLSAYPPPIVQIVCPRCRRTGTTRIAAAIKRHGDVTLAELARLVAAAGGCALAAEAGMCSARPIEPPVDYWGSLDNARLGGWRVMLHCCRRFVSMKPTNPCPGPIELDVMSLVAALEHDFPLDRLPTRLRCPQCSTKSIELEWHVPKGPPDPGGATQAAPVLQMRPTRAAMGRRRFRVVEGG